LRQVISGGTTFSYLEDDFWPFLHVRVFSSLALQLAAAHSFTCLRTNHCTQRPRVTEGAVMGKGNPPNMVRASGVLKLVTA